MRTLTTQTPDQTQWRVRVAWLPRWRFLARRFGGWRRRRGKDSGGSVDLPDVSGIGGGHGGGGGDGGFFSSLADEVAVILLVLFAFVAAALLFWFLLLPLLLLLVDVLVVVLLCLVAGVARVLFRRPWTVEAEVVGGGFAGRRFLVDVVGWRAALRLRDDIAGKLRDGYTVETLVHSLGGRWAGVPARA